MRILRISYLFMFSLLLLFGCEDKVKEFDYVVLNNKVLEREIINYHGRPDQSPALEGGKVYTVVYCKSINDSTIRYALDIYNDYDFPKFFPFHFVCKVAGEDVFFVMCGGGIGNPFQHDFKRSDDDLKRFRDIYYPNPVKKTPGGQVAVCICHPDVCFLTFVNGRLVDKCYQKGMPSQKVKVNIDGKEYLW